jgi:hypothetical protein
MKIYALSYADAASGNAVFLPLQAFYQFSASRSISGNVLMPV